MPTVTSIITRGILALATVGGLAVLADGAVRVQLERAMRDTLDFVGDAPALARVARVEDRYVAKGLDRTRLGAIVLMVGADDAG